jgi:hypothetical protein
VVTRKERVIKGQLETSLSVAKWFVGIVAPVIVALIGAAFALTWYAAKLD